MRSQDRQSCQRQQGVCKRWSIEHGVGTADSVSCQQFRCSRGGPRKHCTGSTHADEPHKTKEMSDYVVSVVDSVDTFEEKV